MRATTIISAMAHRAPLQLRFGPFTFDEAGARLLAQGRVVALAPKAFDVLGELLHRAGQLVSKDELLDAVWGHRHVSESVLKTTISELRAALGDDAKNPRWVETASRRGYRFIGAMAAPSAPVVEAPAAVTDLVGRERALALLQQAWSRAAAGQRQLCGIAGEAGIGKTTLIDRFAASLGEVAIAHGQCIEQVGEGEPYLPVLDALAALARRDASLVALLRQVAPTWLLQLPWLIERDEQDRLRDGLENSTQDRMLREFSELVEQLTATRPLLLVTEDLHWCDEATVRLFDHVARRRPPARLLWIASYRTPELVAANHPLNGVRHELRARRLLDEFPLDPFSEAELAALVERLRPELAADEHWLRGLHRRTDGLPLFVVNAIDDLAARASGDDAGSDDWAVPDSLVGVVERHVARLAPDATALLEAAAVRGVEFEASVVARMLSRDLAEVAARCAELSRQQYWLADATVDALADGTLDPRFTFRHSLYRQVLYRRLDASGRIALHRRAAAALEAQGGGGASAASLALHHERGLQPMAAMHAYAAASDRALGRFAPREALLLADRGLGLLGQSPDSESRRAVEFTLVHLRGASLAYSVGVSSPEGRAAFQRADELGAQLPPTPERSWALAGQCWMLIASGEFAQALATARRLQAAADAAQDDLLRAAAIVSRALPLVQGGQLADAAAALDEAMALTQALGHPRPPTPVMLDPTALAFAMGAVVCAQRGEIVRSQSCMATAIARADALGLPAVRGMTGRLTGMVDARLDRLPELLASSARLYAHVLEHGLRQGVGPGLSLHGWSRARLGEPVEGLRQLEQAYAAHVATGARFESTSMLRMAADAALLAGDAITATRHVDEGFAVAEQIGERIHVPDLWLTRAAIAAAAGDLGGARAAANESARQAAAMGALTAELQARLFACELSGAGAAEFAVLREVRARWNDPTTIALVTRVDDRLAAA